MAVCLVDITDDNVSENHCASNSSSTKTVSSSSFSQHILTMIVGVYSHTDAVAQTTQGQSNMVLVQEPPSYRFAMLNL